MSSDNPLVQLPLLGLLLGLLDKALLDSGFPLWLAEFVEFVLTIVLLFVGVGLVLRRLVPWLFGSVLQWPIWGLVELVRVTLLLPEWLVTRSLELLGRRPAGIVYGYGDGVLALADGMHSVIRQSLPQVYRLRRLKRWPIWVLLILGFLLWNNFSCVAAAPAPCVSPTGQWTTSVSNWLAQHATKPSSQ